jgi:hypothetical protein
MMNIKELPFKMKYEMLRGIIKEADMAWPKPPHK